MKKYKVVYRKTTERVAIVEAKSLDGAVEEFNNGEVLHDIELCEVADMIISVDKSNIF